jgi:hypothetical protein
MFPAGRGGSVLKWPRFSTTEIATEPKRCTEGQNQWGIHSRIWNLKTLSQRYRATSLRSRLTFLCNVFRNVPLLEFHLIACTSVFDKVQIINSNWGVTMKFTELFYCKNSCILKAYWEGSPSKYPPWAAVQLAQRSCHCWKHFWNSSCWMSFSVHVTFSILKSSSIKGWLYFWKRPEVIRNQIRGIELAFPFSNRFFLAKNCVTVSCLWVGSLLWWRIYTQFHVTASICPHNKLG